jgi:hypothetical protein
MTEEELVVIVVIAGGLLLFVTKSFWDWVLKDVNI